MDAVSDRDFAIELAFVCSLVDALSRLAEETVIWSTAGLACDLTIRWHGPSIMPQKKNPDVAGLRGEVRPGSGRACRASDAAERAAPHVYARFAGGQAAAVRWVDSTIACLSHMERLLASSTFNAGRLAELLTTGSQPQPTWVLVTKAAVPSGTGCRKTGCAVSR